jgi:hypothetical protein
VYTNIPGKPLQYATIILGCLAFFVTMPIYVFYKKGPVIRERSKFAQSLDRSRQESYVKRKKSVAGPGEMKQATEKEEHEHVDGV